MNKVLSYGIPNKPNVCHDFNMKCNCIGPAGYYSAAISPKGRAVKTWSVKQRTK